MSGCVECQIWESGRDESWRPIVGFPAYEISDFGRVRSYLRLGTKRKLWTEPVGLSVCISNNGYKFIVFPDHDSRKRKYIHRLVLESFLGPCPAGMEACHNNGDRTDCRVDNLRWDTRSGNSRDKVKHGTQAVGEAWHASRLTEQQVIAIRAGGRSDKEFAAQFGVCSGTVWAVRHRKTWRHVP